MKKIILIASCALIALAAAAPAAADNAAKNWKKSCSMCHGAKGQGGAMAKMDMGKDEWQKQYTDEQLTEATTKGEKAAGIKVSKKMPAYEGKLKDAEIKDLVTLMRGFGGKKADKAEKKASKKAEKQADKE